MTEREKAYVIIEERNRCLAWVEFARSVGETDMRQVRSWINSSDWPSDEDKEEYY